MIKLSRLGKNEWMVVCHSKMVFCAGDICEIRQCMMEDLDIEEQEFEIAVVDILTRGHNQADFGVLGRFTYSCNTDITPPWTGN